MVAFRLPGTAAALADATLLLETVCPACQGAGVVASAHWQMFHAFYRRWRDRNPKPARSAPQAVRADWLLGHDQAAQGLAIHICENAHFQQFSGQGVEPFLLVCFQPGRRRDIVRRCDQLPVFAVFDFGLC